eukprot:scaffold1331_cov119-Isochrysis_galbana.AAC.2
MFYRPGTAHWLVSRLAFLGSRGAPPQSDISTRTPRIAGGVGPCSTHRAALARDAGGTGGWLAFRAHRWPLHSCRHRRSGVDAFQCTVLRARVRKFHATSLAHIYLAVPTFCPVGPRAPTRL